MFPGFHTRFTKGGVNIFRPAHLAIALDKDMRAGKDINDMKPYAQKEDEADGFIGWYGLGGSGCLWERNLNIGFAYVPIDLKVFDFINTRAVRI